MKEITIRLNQITHEEAMEVQYELSKMDQVYRAFINPYQRIARVIADGMKTEELLKFFEKFKPEVVEEKDVSLEEVIERSMSWNNILKS
ncbi:DUF3213 domain-containing protein [Pyrococcus abyssi]|uniref:Uncharacterized protein n=1 Tax=Pyrococcus abyssi (strain GE5 / Orsay) TaxID=272844 RepID=G8ZJG8_PYRAB|nr:DUF3213 domain-containing protein [Pyrococcus abyssi]CCE70095.1 TPA: hypothetical protein PAB0482.1n [Pyrococcus abyssi GE5]